MSNPCGCSGMEHEQAVAALVYLTENYGCGNLTAAHLKAAIKDGKSDEVADLWNGSYHTCQNNPNGWCHASPITGAQIARFSSTADYFVDFMKKGIESPGKVFERTIAEDVRVTGLVEKVYWMCGWTSTRASIGDTSTSGSIDYGSIEIFVKGELTENDLMLFHKVALEQFSMWAGAPLEPNRIKVTPGKSRHVDTPSHPDMNLPTIKIHLFPPPCPS